MSEPAQPNREWLDRMADAEDAAGCISVGGMAADLGQPLPTATDTIGGFPYADPNCKGCGKALTVENAWMTDGCPCNSGLGVNSMNETRWRLLMQLQQDQSREIARLRAEVARLRGTLAGILEKAKWMRDFSSQPHQSKSWDVVTQFAFNALGEPSRAELRAITAALADTADKPNEGAGNAS